MHSFLLGHKPLNKNVLSLLTWDGSLLYGPGAQFLKALKPVNFFIQKLFSRIFNARILTCWDSLHAQGSDQATSSKSMLRSALPCLPCDAVSRGSSKQVSMQAPSLPITRSLPPLAVAEVVLIEDVVVVKARLQFTIYRSTTKAKVKERAGDKD